MTDMQIDVDFQVFKALTAHRESESDSCNAVIRRLLGLDGAAVGLNAFEALGHKGQLPTLSDYNLPPVASPKRRGLFGSGQAKGASPTGEGIGGLLSQFAGGVWFSNVHFPEGTHFRATYKGQTYLAEIRDGRWIGSDGKSRNSPSEAAGAISGTSVNGWRFWHVQMPGDPAWRRLDELKQ